MNIIKGSSVKVSFFVYEDDEKELIADLTGAIIKLFIKKRDTDTDAQKLFEIDGSVVNSTTGEAEAIITAAQSDTLGSYNILVYEIVVKLNTSYYIRSGVKKMYIKPNVAKTLF